MRLSGTKTSSVNQYNGLGDQLYDLGGARPTLDLNFSSNQSLVDSVTGKTLVDHTRQSSATYVDGDGVIRTAVTNLVLQSEDFSTTWSTSNASVTVNDIAAPDGSITADKVVGSTPAITLYQTISGSFAAGSTYTVSVWIKATGSDIGKFVRVGLRRADGTALQQEHNIVALTGDWQRVSQSITWSVARTAIFVEIRTDFIPGGDPPADNFYLWGAQLEQSSTVGQYVKTTTAKNGAPRFDHDPTTGESLGLLVEESRTNIHKTNHTGLTGSGTSNGDRLHWDENSTDVSAPDGTSSTFKVYVDGTETAPTSSLYIVNTVNTTYTSTNIHTSSVFIKPVKETLFKCVAHNHYASDTDLGTGANIEFDFDLSTPTGSVNIETGGISASVTPYPNGWYRCTWTYYRNSTNPKDSLYGVIIYPGGYSSANGLGVGTICYLWGPQVEAGSFPTSYIPTTSSTVTRAADVTSITGRNFGSVNLLEYSEEFDQGSWVRSQGSVISNATSAPNGTITADQFIENTATSQHALLLGQTITANTTYTLSCYIKAANRSTGWVQFNNSTYSSGVRAIFNLSAATATAVNFGTGSGAVASIASAGDGWYRVSIGGVVDASSTTGIVAIYLNDGLNYAGDGTSGIYIWGAQLEEGSTATDYIKSDVNWTSRASNATYYDVNGTLKKSSYNLLLQSENLETTWAKAAVSVTANQRLAPDGQLSMDTVTATGGAGYLQQTVTVANSTVYNFSIYVYSAANRIRLIIHNGSSDICNIAWTSLSAGTTSATGTSTNIITTPVGNSIYRLSFSFTSTSTTANLRIQPLDSSGAAIVGATADCWGAQLEKGTYAGDYVKTEGSAASTARTAAYLPDGNGNFVSAGDLLLEGAGTNLVTYSEDFSQSIYQKINITASSYTEDAPDGSQTAALFLETTTNNGHFVYYNASQSITQGTTSVWVKPLGRSFMSLRHFGSSNNWLTVVFDVTGSGSVTDTQHGTLSTYTDVSSDIESYPNGWYRLSVTASRSGGLYLPLIVHTNTSGTPTFNSSGEEVFGGDTAKGFYIWGAQLEESPYATSYIPTTGSTATRAADVSTSAATFGNSWYEQSEGTVFAETIYNNDTSGATAFFNNASYNNLISLQRDPSLDRWQADYFSGGSRQALLNLQTSTAPTGIAAKAATSYKVDSFNASANGGAIISDASGLVPVGITRVSLGFENVGGGAYVNGTISRLTYWPTRLSNDTLQTITT